MNMLKHLIGRNFNLSLYKNITVTDKYVTFPLYNLSGQMVGYQQYNPTGSKSFRGDPRDGKYFTYISRSKNITAWGLDSLNPSDKVIYLVEGIFSACRFHNYGLNALAVLGNNPKHLKDWLNSLGYHIHPVCDGDKAGRKLAKFGRTYTLLGDESYIDEMRTDDFYQFTKSLRRNLNNHVNKHLT